MENFSRRISNLNGAGNDLTPRHSICLSQASATACQPDSVVAPFKSPRVACLLVAELAPSDSNVSDAS